jgi:hypothetical protein
MRKVKYIVLLVLIISGCDDMKMDRKVVKQMTLAGSTVLSLLA